MRSIVLVAVMLATCLPGHAETIAVPASRDATLIEDPDGALANGSGPVFFVGRTNQMQNSVRRAVVFFDVAGSLPEHALVEEVTLELNLLAGNPAPSAIRLHRVLAPWGEGPSSSSGGGGAPSQAGDVTWLHTYFDGELWMNPGGQFVSRASAEAIAGDTGSCTWGDTHQMVQDVRRWNNAPHMNFGWILLGDETTAQTSKPFASRENIDPGLRPLLWITYRLPGDAPTP